MSEFATAIVVIPTYNEADNIQAVIDRVRSAAPLITILVVDDNSRDGTADLVRDHRDHLHQVFLLHGQKAGLGAAYRAGFRWALDRGYDAIVQMDADLSHSPERISALLGALDTADVAIGSRYVAGGGITHWTWSRRLISQAGNAFVRAVLGLSVVEVPITFADRAFGTSKMSGRIVFEAVLRVLAWRWQEIWPVDEQGRPRCRCRSVVSQPRGVRRERAACRGRAEPPRWQPRSGRCSARPSCARLE